MFISHRLVNGESRVITAASGRLDFSDERSELVLSTAVIYTLGNADSVKRSVERVGTLRFAVATQRSDLIKKLSATEKNPEELGLLELLENSKTKSGEEAVDSRLLFQRKVILSISPFLFTIFGCCIALRMRGRSGGAGISLALIGLVIFFLVTLGSEQLARKRSNTGAYQQYFAYLIHFAGNGFCE